MSDDDCGIRFGPSQMMYYVDEAVGTPCGYVTLVQGCYDEKRCAGVTHVRVAGAGAPTSIPSGQPSTMPTAFPSSPSSDPTGQPSAAPSGEPSSPSGEPSGQPSAQPTGQPSFQPTVYPSSRPSVDNSTTPPSPQPTPGPKPDLQTTLIIAIGTPASMLFLAASAVLLYRYLRERYSAYLDVNARVSCLSLHPVPGGSTLKFCKEFEDVDLDLFADGDFEDLYLGR